MNYLIEKGALPLVQRGFINTFFNGSEACYSPNRIWTPKDVLKIQFRTPSGGLES